MTAGCDASDTASAAHAGRGSSGASPRGPTPVRLIVFPGGFNWPVWVGQAKGWFAHNGIELDVTPTPGSVFQLSGLIEGRFDIAITLIDNVIAYRSGQGEVPVTGPDLVAFMAADTRVLPTLITLPEITRYDDLRGSTLSVDAMTTGYAFVLRAMLAHGGLAPHDYTLDSIGGAQQRYDDMRARGHAGCLLNSPFEGLLQAEGFTALDTAADVIGKYQGQVAATRQSWAAAHPEAVAGFVRSFLMALDWLYDARHHDEACAIFRANVPGATDDAARTAHGVLFNRRNGFPVDGRIDPEALANVIALRSRFGLPARALGVPSDYYDSRYLEQALRAPS
jgi:ABC-type nitrate/sulfonate/bicarbonate transport system substrate-binding protein